MRAPRLLSVVLLALLAACDPRDALRGMRAAPVTAHERYGQALREAGLDSTALGREWLAASDSALRAPLVATLPSQEAGVYTRDEARALAVRVTLREGERLRASVATVGAPARLYLDLFEVTGDTARPFVHRATADSVTADGVALAYEARSAATVVVRLQPELLRAGRYTLTLRAEPQLAFPVEGRDARAIQSLFGVARDGGARDHQGIDIFAPRGTPVLAATDGVVRSVSPNALGGNVVWLSDTDRGQSLYYAHLDRHYVAAGQPVRTGDTLGFVGNTGNARTTPPHLHFGIYRRGQGAVDPLVWVRPVAAGVPVVRADTAGLGRRGAVRLSALDLRQGPSGASPVLRRMAAGDSLRVMGAALAWYRVQLADGTAGYVAPAAVRLLRERTPDRPESMGRESRTTGSD